MRALGFLGSVFTLLTLVGMQLAIAVFYFYLIYVAWTL